MAGGSRGPIAVWQISLALCSHGEPFGRAVVFPCSRLYFLGLPLEFGGAKMVPLWSRNNESIWPSGERYDAAYSQSYGNSLTAGKSH